ncbi:MAG: hypothetical protein ACK53Y_19180, partial [bacterium]
NTGCYLTYPTFTIEINDSFDGIVSGHMADPFHQVHFNAHQAGCVAAVSDNTHHCAMHRPPCIRPSRPKNASKRIPFLMTFWLMIQLMIQLFLLNILHFQTPLLIVNPLESATVPDRFFTTLGLDASDFTMSPLSPK